MDIMKKIHDTFNPKKNVDWGNEYKPKPKVQSTVKCGNSDFNETFKHIHNELMKSKNINA